MELAAHFENRSLANIFIRKPKALCKAVANKWTHHDGDLLTSDDIALYTVIHKTVCKGCVKSRFANLDYVGSTMAAIYLADIILSFGDVINFTERDDLTKWLAIHRPKVYVLPTVNLDSSLVNSD